MDNQNKFKATFRNLDVNIKSRLSDKEVVLLISPDHDYHEGEKLLSIINLINKTNFQRCCVVIGDTNYRHTLSITFQNSTEKMLYSEAKRIGDNWIERNTRFLTSLQVPYKITRWDEWLNHPHYQKQRTNFEKVYKKNSFLQKAFYQSALSFVNRFADGSSIVVSQEEAINFSIDYLKEECIIIMPMWAELGIDTIIYPNKMLNAMKATYEQVVVPAYGDNLLWLTLRFKRYYSRDFVEEPPEMVVDY
jgi:tRNA-dependent cyclodipeptide synthase